MNEDLRAELLRRVAADQEARHARDAEAAASADGENLPWLRQVITNVGWPRMWARAGPRPARSAATRSPSA